jgi:hypothetical protein
LLFLQKDSPVFAYDLSLYSIVEDGALLATVDSSGGIHLPAKESDVGRAFQGRIRTMADLRAAAGEPPRDIRLVGSDAVATRE